MTDSYTRVVDGVPIVEDRCRVSGQFHVLGKDSRSLHVGTDAVIVIVGRVSAPTFSESKDGEFKRVNVFKPHEMRVLSDDALRDRVLDRLNFDIRPEVTDYPDNVQAKVDEEPSIKFEDTEEWGPAEVGEDTTPVFEVELEPSAPAEEVDEVVEVHLPANRSGKVEESDEEDEDGLLAEFRNVPPARVAVGGGIFAEGDDAERLRGWISS